MSGASRLRAVLAFGSPTLLLAAACLGLASANWAAPPPRAALAAALVAGLLALFVAGPARLALAGVALAALGLWWGALRLDALDRSLLEGQIDRTEEAQVVVTAAPTRSPFAIRAIGEVRRFGRLPIRERVLLELPAGRAPPRGALLALRARPVAPRGPETGFDERGWLERRGIHVVLRADPGWRIVGRRGGIGGVGDRLRTAIGRGLGLGASGERLALLAGVVLGADEGLAPDLRDAFRASGLYHLLAVSGQNVVFVALGVLGLAYLAGAPRALGHCVAILAVLGYALAVGWQPSVVRAAVAGCVASLAWLASRPSDRWHVLALGALVLLAWTPRSLLEPGFQLSFLAVAAILVSVPRLAQVAERWPVPRAIVDVVGISAACGVVTAPVLWLQFGVVPLWSVPANVLAEPAMPLLLGSGLAAALVAPIAPTAAVAMSWLAGLAAAWIAFTARLVAGFPYAQVSSPLAVALPLIALAVVAALRRVPPYRRGLVLRGIALLLLGGVLWWAASPPTRWHPPSGLRVTMLDVGQGDAILLETPEGAVLVDSGPPEADVARRLRRSGLRSLAALLLSHPHRDHAGGAAAIIESLDVGALVDPLQPGSHPDSAAARRAAERAGTAVVAGRRGASYALGRLRLRLLSPEDGGPPGADPHEHGLVLLATYGATDVLLTGDSESPVLRRLPLRRVEILKVAHHGSSDPGLAKLLDVLRPQAALISVGTGNDYGHPRAETLAALEAVPGLTVYRTDEDGAIVLESDGTRFVVRGDT